MGLGSNFGESLVTGVYIDYQIYGTRPRVCLLIFVYMPYYNMKDFVLRMQMRIHVYGNLLIGKGGIFVWYCPNK